MTNTTYILLKDLPDVKAGAKFKWNEYFGVYVAEGAETKRTESNNWLFINGYPKKYVEDNIEWFEPMELKYSLYDLRKAFDAGGSTGNTGIIRANRSLSNMWSFQTFDDYLKSINQ